MNDLWWGMHFLVLQGSLLMSKRASTKFFTINFPESSYLISSSMFLFSSSSWPMCSFLFQLRQRLVASNCSGVTKSFIILPSSILQAKLLAISSPIHPCLQSPNPRQTLGSWEEPLVFSRWCTYLRVALLQVQGKFWTGMHWICTFQTTTGSSRYLSQLKQKTGKILIRL